MTKVLAHDSEKSLKLTGSRTACNDHAFREVRQQAWASLVSANAVRYDWCMTLDELKAEMRAASPEVREELYTFLGVLRRANDPGRVRSLAAKLDEPGRWISEEEAARRLGQSTGEGN